MTTFSELVASWDTIKSPIEDGSLKKDEIARFIENNINLQNISTHAITAVDLRTNQYLFVDDRIEQVTGYTKLEYEKSGPKLMFSKIPLLHKIGVIRTTLHQNRLVSNSNKEEIKDLIINREINVIDKQKKSRRILDQVLDHIYDAAGKIQAVISLQTQIGHLSSASNFK